MRTTVKRNLVLAIIGVLLVSCSLPVTKVQVQSFEMRKQSLSKVQSLNMLTGILVDRGFDIKITNKDVGLVTTEYKKFTSQGESPPFDYYLQIRGRVKIMEGVAVVELRPTVKEQNRLNAAAFTEHELAYYTGEPNTIRLIPSMKPDVGWRALAQVNFMNVVQDVADGFGLSSDEVIQNVTNTQINAFGKTSQL